MRSNLSSAASAISAIPEPETYAAILGLLGLGLALTRRVRGNRKNA